VWIRGWDCFRFPPFVQFSRFLSRKNSSKNLFLLNCFPPNSSYSEEGRTGTVGQRTVVGRSESLVMKTWPKILVTVAIGGRLLAGGAPLFAKTTDDTSAGAIQAIQQASDPSAAIAAYANGIATDRNNPRIHEAYIAKMIDLGLPEMAFHQAESLTGLESNNGLAWGVIAYVDARRGQMPEAISAVVLAGQFAPDNPFVQRTAGELTAWYDLKADKSTLSDSTKEAVAKLRASLNKHTAFADAYNAATKAYQAPATTTPTTPPAQSSVNPNYAPAQQDAGQLPPDYYGPPYAPSDYADAGFPPPYYPDYGPYYWGPGWISPAAWWWWPVGGWFGFSFFPCSSFIVFNHHHGFFHDGFHKGKFHDGSFAHNGSFHATKNGGKFFGSHTGPTFAHSVSSTSTFHGSGSHVGTVTSTHSTSFGRGFTSTTSTHAVTPTSRTGTMGNNFSGRTWNNSGVATRSPGVTTRTWNGSTGMGSRGMVGRTPASSAFANRSWNTTAMNNRAWAPARQGFAPQSFSGRSFSMPQNRSFAMGNGMGGFRGGSMGGAPAFHGGGMGGGFHGGSMGGGGFHGGGGMGGGHGGGGGHR
jgi:hypothetical protein